MQSRLIYAAMSSWNTPYNRCRFPSSEHEDISTLTAIVMNMKDDNGVVSQPLTVQVEDKDAVCVWNLLH
jgi:hypothetical protein